ncbi:LiaI-LiaF-like domain-containing protein [Sphingobacterium corticibacterium]|uniref:LiaI-LiaF-like transmembrane region domain-containing protein n=1 Tax=Sphingobacterium corticibacterium TaxID=2484746 RepID=A0A4Q6XPZ7_9SPHI|nr:DUF5668 domain-containing protein [Sphingobacterium corticibacterium]RZF58216.1 hypothetical protein EWE74_19395 [Sphingobacterium corticibacterium]
MENKITSGIWFVFIGVVLLLHNLDIIHFNFWAIIKYWPLLIVIAGVNLIAQDKLYGNYIKIGCNLLFLGWILYVGMSASKADWTEPLYNNKYINIDNTDKDATLSDLVQIPFDSAMKESALEFNGGAGKFEMKVEEKNNLVSARSKANDMGMSMKTALEDGKQKVVINAKPTSKGKKSDAVLLNLHADVRWNLNLNYGAANINGDLSTLKFGHLEINTGASNMNLTLGLPQVHNSKIDIATAASKIHFRIPKEAAIKVEYTSILSKNSFEGFETNESGIAKTANYDEAENKFNIELEGAANNFTITRY